jgi:hypothetical protein
MGTLFLRGSIVWPLTAIGPRWYAGGGVAGYFPEVGWDPLPAAPFGVETVLGRRGGWGLDNAYLELRLGYLTSNVFRGGTIQMLAGVVP